MTRPLYHESDLYKRLFPVDDEELAFFNNHLAGCRSVLDAAGGGCDLARLLSTATRRVIPVDLSRAMVRAAGGGVVADLAALPFADGVFDGALSRLLGYGYALGALGPDRLADPSRELGRVLAKGSPVTLEVPLAHSPARLQGVGERANLPGLGTYRFNYWDLLEATAYGAVLAAEIVLESGGGVFRIDDRLHVFTPGGARDWLAAGGVELRGFCAPYDAGTFSPAPPPETMRAVVVGRRIVTSPA